MNRIHKNILFIVRPLHPDPASGDSPAFINYYLEVDYISLTDFLKSTGKWTSIMQITPSLTGYPRNHNAGIERNIY